MADRPHVTVHILQSVDGRIAGPFMREAYGLVGAYGSLREELGFDCLAWGATTAQELFGCPRPSLSHPYGPVPAGDFVARTDLVPFAFVDPNGTVGFTRATGSRGGVEGHFVQLLREDVDPCYLAYLRGVGVSYLLSGVGSLDVPLALRKLGSLFGVRRMVCQGGGYANGTLAAAGCVDELSLVVAPVAAVAGGVPALFETVPGLDAGPTSFDLAEVRKLEAGGVWLHYTRR